MRALGIGLAFVIASLCSCAEKDLPSENTAGVREEDRFGGGEIAFGDPLPGLTAAEQTRFLDGKQEFGTVETEEDGLGPVENGNSCGACHSTPALGGGDDTVETRFGAVVNGLFDPLVAQGGSLIQTTGIGQVSQGCPVDHIDGEAVPQAASVVAGRRTTPLFGLGLVDAVPDAVFLAIAASQQKNSDGVRGVANLVVDLASGKQRVGKFGWKAQNPSLSQFSADAYLNEMGITSTLFPKDNCPQGDCTKQECDLVPGIEDTDGDVGKFADFMTFLAPPPARALTLVALAGAIEFARIGCVTCHVSTLTTGPNASAALDRVTLHPYSDFLLHDMGALGDGIAQGPAGPRAMRTSPLWGVSHQPIYLHDGRAHTLEEAILAHDGEAAAARKRYAKLQPLTQQALLSFLKSL